MWIQSGLSGADPTLLATGARRAFLSRPGPFCPLWGLKGQTGLRALGVEDAKKTTQAIVSRPLRPGFPNSSVRHQQQPGAERSIASQFYAPEVLQELQSEEKIGRSVLRNLCCTQQGEGFLLLSVYQNGFCQESWCPQ